ncbi:hypothetical protein PVAP13_6NG115212 [Panicum virgatum]|uniref:Uncharacterized protein n=1 Tax=Panicum virgatum TaxID=38727 RepID=A0A8T0R0J0_PANVG|nr:hypothetical protein PVAP13_6NG115212 [Panicum virgatum]
MAPPARPDEWRRRATGKSHQDAVYRSAAGHGAAEQRKIDLKAKPRCRWTTTTRLPSTTCWSIGTTPATPPPSSSSSSSSAPSRWRPRPPVKPTSPATGPATAAVEARHDKIKSGAKPTMTVSPPRRRQDDERHRVGEWMPAPGCRKTPSRRWPRGCVHRAKEPIYNLAREYELRASMQAQAAVSARALCCWREARKLQGVVLPPRIVHFVSHPLLRRRDKKRRRNGGRCSRAVARRHRARW